MRCRVRSQWSRVALCPQLGQLQREGCASTDILKDSICVASRDALETTGSLIAPSERARAIPRNDYWLKAEVGVRIVP